MLLFSRIYLGIYTTTVIGREKVSVGLSVAQVSITQPLYLILPFMVGIEMHLPWTTQKCLISVWELWDTLIRSWSSWKQRYIYLKPHICSAGCLHINSTLKKKKKKKNMSRNIFRSFSIRIAASLLKRSNFDRWLIQPYYVCFYCMRDF